MANSVNNSRKTSGSSGSGNNTRKRNDNKNHMDSGNTNARRQTTGSRNTSADKSRSRSTSARNGRNSARRRRQKQQRVKRLMLIAEIVLIVAAVIGGIIYFRKHKDPTVMTAKDADNEDAAHVMVNGIDITGLSRDEAKKALLSQHEWKFVISYQGNTYEVDNLFEKEIDAVLHDAYSPGADAEYTVAITDTEEAAAEIAGTVSDMWSQPAVDAAITGYNSETGEFILSDSEPGYVVDVDRLSSDIASALDAGNYVTTIEAAGENSAPRFEKDDYQILGTYSTTATNNSNRNTNIQIACDTICGTILQPQERFSYNTILGRRTADKGYKEAGAYANGEHVLELGGGICQVSSTIYNATIFANLQIDERTGHTYEPSYVTPGEDAAVSYSNPDFVFTNNTGATLGIKTTFKDRTVVATVFGVPTLEEGVKRYMRSEKIADVAPPEDKVVEDPTLLPGQTQVVSGPKNGSKWATYIILEKDGEIISEEYLHTTTYRGTAAEIHVNTTGVVDPAAIIAMQQQQQAAQQQQEAMQAQQAAQAEQQQQQEAEQTPEQ